MLTKAITVLSLSGRDDILDPMCHTPEPETQDMQCGRLGYPLAIAKLQRRSFLSSLGIHIVAIVFLASVHPSPYALRKTEAPSRPTVVTVLYFRSRPTPRVPTESVTDRSFRGLISLPRVAKPRLFAAMPSIDATKELTEVPMQPRRDIFPSRGLVEPTSAVTTTPRLLVPAGFTEARQTGSADGAGGHRVLLGPFPLTRESFSDAKVRSGEVRGAGFPAVGTPNLQIPKRTLVPPVMPAFEKAKIIDMPKPDYTALARTLGIQGVVRIAVVFKADGTVVVTGITHSLGFGLDEAAAAAVTRIRFQPARSSDGKGNVDQPGVVEAVFQLSYRALIADEIKFK